MVVHQILQLLYLLLQQSLMHEGGRGEGGRGRKGNPGGGEGQEWQEGGGRVSGNCQITVKLHIQACNRAYTLKKCTTALNSVIKLARQASFPKNGF